MSRHQGIEASGEQGMNQNASVPRHPLTSSPAHPLRHRGVAIVLVIVAVAAAAVIGSAYVASQLNAPQIVSNVNDGIQSRYIADSGADLATAIMECETFDWRSAQSDGVLVSGLPIGNGKVDIRVKDISGANPGSTCEYPVVVTSGSVGDMRQLVGMQVRTPLPEKIEEETVSVDLSEFAAFGASSINVMNGWIARWPAAPMSEIGLPVKVGTNATTRGSLIIAAKTNAPDALGYVMATAAVGTISDSAQVTVPIRRVNFSNNETVLLPACPTPDFSGLLWASARTPTITTDTTVVSPGDRRYNSITIDNRATLKLDLGGVKRTMAISGPLTIQNEAVLQVENGQLDIVVTGAFNMFNRAAIEIGPGVSLRIFAGGTMSINDSVIGLPVRWRDFSRDARKGMDEYFDPRLCTIYRITSINSVDINLLDLDTAATWVWSDNTSKSWILNQGSYICARVYGAAKADISIDNRTAIFGNVVGRSIILANGSVVYYDHCLDQGTGYTNPKSALYAADMDLRDDIRLLLTDLNDSTLGSILALLAAPPPLPIPIDPFAATPRDKARVTARWMKRYGVKVERDRATPVEDVIAAGGG